MKTNHGHLKIRLMSFSGVALAAMACTASIGASVAPIASPDGVVIESASPTFVDPDPVNPPVVSDPPLTYPADNMWGFLSTSAGTPSGTGNLREAAALSDLVLLGRFVGLERGGGYGAPNEGVGWYAIALIDIESRLQGNPSLGQDGLLRVPFLLALGVPGDNEPAYPEKEFADLSRSIPKDPALLFLSSWTAYFDRAGTEVPGWLADLDRSDIYRTIGADGAVRVVDGVLQTAPYFESWNSSLNGLTMDDLVL